MILRAERMVKGRAGLGAALFDRINRMVGLTGLTGFFLGKDLC